WQSGGDVRVTPLPNPGVYARRNAASEAARLPDGSESAESVSTVLRRRGAADGGPPGTGVPPRSDDRLGSGGRPETGEERPWAPIGRCRSHCDPFLLAAPRYSFCSVVPLADTSPVFDT